MDKNFMALVIVIFILMLIVGLRRSHVSGIQPGYFEKAEAPAYGVGGVEKAVEGIDEDFQKYYENLAGEEE
jgi:hypothetical protein